MVSARGPEPEAEAEAEAEAEIDGEVFSEVLCG